MSKYNLLEEKFIPVIDKNVANYEVGIKELLSNAHLIQSIRFGEPLCNFAWHRFLIGMLYHIFGIKTKEDWNNIYTNGKFCAEIINKYCEKHKKYFYLIDDKYPFYQDITANGKEQSPNLLRMLPDNESSLYCQEFSDDFTLSLHDTSRYIVSCCLLSCHGGPGFPNSQYVESAHGACSAVINGKNLFETLLFNALPLDVANLAINAKAENDGPWYVNGKREQRLSGYMDYLTRPCRKLKLIEKDGRITKALWDKGCVPATVAIDPFSLYWENKQDSKGRNKALWIEDQNLLWQNLLSFVITKNIEDKTIFLNLAHLSCYGENALTYRIFINSTDSKSMKYKANMEVECLLPTSNEKIDQLINIQHKLFEMFEVCRKNLAFMLINFKININEPKCWELAANAVYSLHSIATNTIFKLKIDNANLDFFKKEAMNLINQTLLYYNLIGRKNDKDNVCKHLKKIEDNLYKILGA